jgi:hypothetical protein
MGLEYQISENDTGGRPSNAAAGGGGGGLSFIFRFRLLSVCAVQTLLLPHADVFIFGHNGALHSLRVRILIWPLPRRWLNRASCMGVVSKQTCCSHYMIKHAKMTAAAGVGIHTTPNLLAA